MVMQAVLLLVLAAAANAQTSSELRVASFNVALNRFNAGDLLEETRSSDSDKIKRVAATLQLVDADVVLLNEVDYDATEETYRNLINNYFSVPQTKYGANKTLEYTYFYAAPSNTGLLSTMDLNGDGNLTLPSDAFGFGFFEGQYAFVVMSKYPIEHSSIRTFQTFLWKDMPGNLIPEGRYDNHTIENFRLSSKNHADVPVILPNGEHVHILCSHPTPPVFDSPEFDENGRRNADEIKFFADYVTPGRNSYIYDDRNVTGGLGADDKFFICGDLNADPYDGDGRTEGIAVLLSRYNIVDTMPASEGGAESTNDLPSNVAPGKYDTSHFSPFTGNLRVDYVLPSANMHIKDSGVFWPKSSDPLYPLANATATSDHRLVFVDVQV